MTFRSVATTGLWDEELINVLPNSFMFALREGKWRNTPEPPALGHDPKGKVLGILGMGGIGRNMKKKCEALGVETIYQNRTKPSEEVAGGAK